jgi:hypothetical protein
MKTVHVSIAFVFCVATLVCRAGNSLLNDGRMDISRETVLRIDLERIEAVTDGQRHAGAVYQTKTSLSVPAKLGLHVDLMRACPVRGVSQPQAARGKRNEVLHWTPLAWGFQDAKNFGKLTFADGE